MKKIQVLMWGMNHIGVNHGKRVHSVIANSDSLFDEEKTKGSLCCSMISNVPTLEDVRMLAERIGILDCVKVKGFQVCVIVSKEWMESIGQEEYKPSELFDTWKRYGTQIGSNLGVFVEEYDPGYERGVGGPAFFPTIELAKDYCRKKCNNRNGNIFSVRDVAKDWHASDLCTYCWSSKEHKMVDITEAWARRFD